MVLQSQAELLPWSDCHVISHHTSHPAGYLHAFACIHVCWHTGLLNYTAADCHGKPLQVESRVSNAYACLFASSAPRHSGDHEIELAGIHCRIKSGCESFGSFKEACAIRALIASNINMAFKTSNFSMKSEVIQRALNFLSSPSGDFFFCLDDEPSAEGTAEEVGLGILTLLGRSDAGSACGRRDRGAIPQRRGGYKEALRGRMVPSGSTGSTGSTGSGAQWAVERLAKLRKMSDVDADAGKDGNEEHEEPKLPNPQASAPSCPSEAKCVEDWATGLVQAALLRVLKKRAAAAEEFDVAARLKARERGTETTLAAGRARAMQPLDEGIL